MRLLLDTHVLLWGAGEPDRLPVEARALIADPANRLSFSTASLWEIAIKSSLGREDFRVDPRLLRGGLIDNGYEELPIGGEHVLQIVALPPIHRDPFDRMLVAQAQVEGMTLLTMDVQLARYPGPVRLLQAPTPRPSSA